MSKIEPQGSNLILEPYEEVVSKSSGGVLLEGDSVPRGRTGKIKFVGPNCSQAKLDDEAVYPTVYGYDMFIDGRRYRVLKEHEIIYFIKKSTDLDVKQFKDSNFGNE